MNATEMSCKELVELVTDYIEGELTIEDTRRFEAHLVICPGCRTFLDQAKWTIRFQREPQVDIPRNILTDMLRIFRDWKRRPDDR
jgi:predicted anti-sigma-YlaC factor YlaD